MMNDNIINLTLSVDVDSLIEASKMLQAMADSLSVDHVVDGLSVDHVVSENDPVKSFGKPAVELVVAEPAVASTVEPLTIIPPGVEIDADGLPWDVRIHATSKKKKKKTNTWKYKRNVDAALVATVETELRATMALPTGSTVDVDLNNTNIAPPPPVAVDAAPPPPVTPVENTVMTFPLFMAKVTDAVAKGTKTQEDVNNAVKQNGLASLPLLSARPDLIPAIDAILFA